MKSFKYTTEKTLRFEVDRENKARKAVKEVLDLLLPNFNDQLVGKKIRSTSNNTFLKKLKLDDYGQVGDWAWKIIFDGSGYAFLKIYNVVQERYLNLEKEYTFLRTDSEGVCLKVFDLTDLNLEEIDSDKQWELVLQAKELEEQLNHITNQVINF